MKYELSGLVEPTDRLSKWLKKHYCEKMKFKRRTNPKRIAQFLAFRIYKHAYQREFPRNMLEEIESALQFLPVLKRHIVSEEFLRLAEPIIKSILPETR